MKFNFKNISYTIVLLILSYAPLSIANMSGVMGPNIDPTDRSIQFRSAISFADDDSQQDFWAYRMHYQHAFNDVLRGRVAVQYRDRGDFEFDFFRTELLYNFKKRAAGESWSSALRFDLRTRRGSRPEEFTVNWGNQWALPNGYRVRTTLVLGQQIAASRQSKNLSVQTRASFSRKLDNGVRIGLHVLNKHGDLGDFGSLDEQSVFLGPTISGKVGKYKYEFRYLNGLTDAARDNNLFFKISTRV